MSKIYNSSVYKIGKVVLKEAPEAIKILEKSYKELSKYSVLRQIRIVMIKIAEAKDELNITVDNAKKIVENKGMVRNE